MPLRRFLLCLASILSRDRDRIKLFLLHAAPLQAERLPFGQVLEMRFTSVIFATNEAIRLHGCFCSEKILTSMPPRWEWKMIQAGDHVSVIVLRLARRE